MLRSYHSDMLATGPDAAVLSSHHVTQGPSLSSSKRHKVFVRAVWKMPHAFDGAAVISPMLLMRACTTHLRELQWYIMAQYTCRYS